MHVVVNTTHKSNFAQKTPKNTNFGHFGPQITHILAHGTLFLRIKMQKQKIHEDLWAEKQL